MKSLRSLTLPAPFTEKESEVQRGPWLALGHRASRYHSQGKNQSLWVLSQWARINQIQFCAPGRA